jgi:hypothetical protein
MKGKSKRHEGKELSEWEIIVFWKTRHTSCLLWGIELKQVEFGEMGIEQLSQVGRERVGRVSWVGGGNESRILAISWWVCDIQTSVSVFCWEGIERSRMRWSRVKAHVFELYWTTDLVFLQGNYMGLHVKTWPKIKRLDFQSRAH